MKGFIRMALKGLRRMALNKRVHKDGTETVKGLRRMALNERVHKDGTERFKKDGTE